jgi:hypothetical protein
MSDRESYVWIAATSEQARNLLEQLAEPGGSKLRTDLSSRETVAQALRDYGIFLSDDAIPDEPELALPSPEQAQRMLDELQRPQGPVPHSPFRPPWCPPEGEAEGPTKPPPHGATLGHVFSVIEQRAQPPTETS